MEAQTASVRGTFYPWWLVLLLGLGSILVGILLLTAPGATLGFLVQALGWFWLIAGVLSIVSSFVIPRLRGWKLFAGILGVIVGFLVIGHPLWSGILVPTVMTVILGIYGLIAGAVLLIGAARGGGWGVAALGAMFILLGVALIVAPFVSTLAIIITGGVLAIVGGIAALINSLDLRREEKAREAIAPAAARPMERPAEEAARAAEQPAVEEAVQIVERTPEEEMERTPEQSATEEAVRIVERPEEEPPVEEGPSAEEERERMDTR